MNPLRGHHRWTLLATLACAAGLLGLTGCGGSDDGSQSEEAVELRIDRERKEAAALARQEQRVERLRAEVKRLKSDKAVDAGAAAGAASTPSATVDSSGVRRFTRRLGT
jgi:cell division protein FtsB